MIGSGLIDWLVVDHYALDIRWELAMRPRAKNIMAIDDLADRVHACDLLLDQNLGRKQQDYCDLLAGNTTTLIGPRFALLRPEFAALRSDSLTRRQHPLPLLHLLISMGGVDPHNATVKILDALQACDLPPDLRITVVMGPHAPWLAQVQEHAVQMPWRTEVLVGVSHMAELMRASDLAIGAAGSTSWERCCLGLPTIQIALANNQLPIAHALHDAGAALMLDHSEIPRGLPHLIAAACAPGRLQIMAKTCSRLTEGKGSELVASCMERFRENHIALQ
jgi:UDP-2,4-diacetamido-2,4,6-trideoxy-beta-L-altropyranose hydrolase